MLGIAAYDSDNESPSAPPAAKDEAKTVGVVPKTSAVVAAGAKAEAKAKASAAGKGKVKDAPLSAKQLQRVRQEIDKAKSATAVVQVVRRNLQGQWHTQWGAESLLQIARRSTARTRKEWADDDGVKQLAGRLKAFAAETTMPAILGTEGVDVLLVALDALRRMGFQDVSDQKEALERTIGWLAADGWKRSVKSLARLLWLAAPLAGEAKAGEFMRPLQTQLRLRSAELDGPDLSLLVASLRREASRNEALLEKVLERLQVQGIHAGLSATDLVEIAEGLNELETTDEAPLRPLGQELLRRRGELAPAESHRVHTAFQSMKLPLPQVWAKPGASQKRDRTILTTTQAFVPQEGHEKKRRGNNEIERTSPPRVVRDYKMMSY